jgi:hypothetical protein
MVGGNGGITEQWRVRKGTVITANKAVHRERDTMVVLKRVIRDAIKGTVAID